MRTLALLAALALAAYAWHSGWLQPERWQAAVAKPEVMYRWKDDKGRLTYGTHPPPGKAAERVNAEDKMSVVSPPPAKPVAAAPTAATSGTQDLKARLMDKAIDGQP